MNNLQSAIIDTIKILTEENNKNLKFDYTKKGKIVAISSDKKTCTVFIDGENSECEVRNGLIADIGDEVQVQILMNNYSAKVVDSKIGALGSGGIVNPSTSTTYIHTQVSSSDIWNVLHNLAKYPSVTIVDSAGSVVIGEIIYVSENEIRLEFQGGFSGNAYLN
jgi:hypothetical protein